MAEETTQKEALHQDKHSTQCPRPQRTLQTLLKLLVRPSMDDPSAKHHLTTANANTAKCHTGCPVLRCGARSENIWLYLLPPEECTVLLQAGSHHTKAHPTHKCQLMCSNHSPECRLCMVKTAFPFFWPIIKTKAKSFKEWEEKHKPQCGYQKYHFCPSEWHCHPGG